MFICFLLQSPLKSSQRTVAGTDDDDSEAEPHSVPLEEADDSLVEAGGSSRPPRSRSTSSKRSSKSSKSSKSGSVVGLLEAIYQDTNTAQKEMRQKVNIWL